MSKVELKTMVNLYEGCIDVLTADRDKGEVLTATSVDVRTLLEQISKEGGPMEKLERAREKIRNSGEPEEVWQERDCKEIDAFAMEICVQTFVRLMQRLEEKGVKLDRERSERLIEGLKPIEESIRVFVVKGGRKHYEEKAEREKEEMKDLMNRTSSEVGNA